jgi:muramoyltetrapeptide carboxypeptidase LdcA involved in peptidoglycan recycling
LNVEYFGVMNTTSRSVRATATVSAISDSSSCGMLAISMFCSVSARVCKSLTASGIPREKALVVGKVMRAGGTAEAVDAKAVGRQMSRLSVAALENLAANGITTLAQYYTSPMKYDPDRFAAFSRDLHAALADDEVAAIHALRGGYGAMRLLPGIDTALLRAKPKLLMGYSDITALHALWAAEGLPSLHAPMPASDLIRPGREDDEATLVALLEGGLPAGSVLAPELEPGEPVHPGVAEGVLIGGNLSLVAALCGTPWAWNPHGAILFLEDVSESLYRVDRYLTQLQLAGVSGQWSVNRCRSGEGQEQLDGA